MPQKSTFSSGGNLPLNRGKKIQQKQNLQEISASKPKASKPKKKKERPPLRDMFTAICQSQLGVECVKEYRFHPVRLWRFDYAFPSVSIALEVEGGVWRGGRHTSPQGFLRDMDKYNSATMLGWAVLRTIPSDLYSAKTIEMLRKAIQARTEARNRFLKD